MIKFVFVLYIEFTYSETGFTRGIISINGLVKNTDLHYPQFNF